MHKHHIVFKSQGGLDFNLNYKFFDGPEDHEGNDSPHMDRQTDLALKQELQQKLFDLFAGQQSYSIAEIAKLLGRTEKYMYPKLKKVKCLPDGTIEPEHLIRHLMGGKLY